ncbi:stomatin-like protein 2, mitochondrial [Cyclospora cayetanensis]|uniref:Stomatin-like protein 2, mitochondrial n=1 Tax=Cyclospora cayetanensis TaxID=88456 RepID=A0A6P6S0S5_9EIME|nr:stomatin-like protein 2, mitochondrial [Cyclospora cayetanensis]
MAYVIERFGRFHRVLPSGLHLLVPVVDRVAYAHSLKEETLIIPNQTAITRDNVTLQIDGVLYVRVEDAYKASYGVENPIFAVTQLAQTTMRSELGKLTLDNTFLERDALNKAIVEAINSAAKPWGVTCLRYEIRDILLPANIRSAMERQAEAERLKRAEVLRSEGERERLVNLALGQKEATILDAEGHAEAVRQRAAAAAESVRRIAETTGIPGGMQALSLQLAENYVSAFGRLAESSNTLIIPADAANTAHMLGQALGVFKAVDKSVAQAPPAVPVAPSPPAATLYSDSFPCKSGGAYLNKNSATDSDACPWRVAALYKGRSLS